MFSKRDIRFVSIILNKNLTDTVLETFGSRRLLHIAAGDRYTELPPEAIHDEISHLEIKVSEIVSESHELLHTLGGLQPASLHHVPTESGPVDINADTKVLRAIRKKITQYSNLMNTVAQKITKTRMLLNDATELQQIAAEIPDGLSLTLCTVMFGEVQAGNQGNASIVTDTFVVRQVKNYAVGISLRQATAEMIRHLRAYGFTGHHDIQTSMRNVKETVTHLSDIIQRCTLREQRIREFYESHLSQWKQSLSEIFIRYTYESKLIAGKKYFLFSAGSVIINGWIDRNNGTEILSLLRTLCNNDFYLKIWTRSEMRQQGMTPPILLNNNTLFKPFERLVQTAGTPGDQELDPTPLSAITYVTMFGVMFGDLGQGLVLVVTGLIMAWYAIHRRQSKDFLYDGGLILASCGVSAAFFGIMYGSVFSNEHILAPLWFNPMENITGLFTAAIGMGASFITVGMVLHLINTFGRGKYGEALFGINGMPGIVLYLAGIFFAFRFLVTGTQPSSQSLAVFMGLPVTVFALRNILEFVFSLRERIFPHGIFEYIVETAVEFIEMCSSFLGNTISFIRTGAFALSHAGLSIAVYTLARMAGADMTSPLPLLIIVCGNIFILLLEGLVCSIQAMRLEYYEFFRRFFQGDGTSFTPYSLNPLQRGEQ